MTTSSQASARACEAARPEVREGFPRDSIPILTEVLGVYRPEHVMGLHHQIALRVHDNKTPILPLAFCTLKQLEVLEVIGNRRLQALPPAVGNLSKLRVLSLSGCTALRELPSTIGTLRELRTLDLTGCRSLQHLPGEIAGLRNLELLDLSDCDSLRSMPPLFGGAPGCVRLPRHLVAPKPNRHLTGMSKILRQAVSIAKRAGGVAIEQVAAVGRKIQGGRLNGAKAGIKGQSARTGTAGACLHGVVS